MINPHDRDQAEEVTSAPSDSLDAGLAAGFGRPADGSSGLGASWRDRYDAPPPVLRPEADGDGAPVLRPRSDAMPAPAESGDRYQLAGEIARGGMGAVLKGRDVELGRELAVKVLLEKYVDRPEVARRFIEEAQIGGQLQHPGVVPVYDIGSFGQRPFFTMKLVKGRTLASILGERTEPAEDRPRLLAIALQVAQTLAYAHAKGVIHRDLKPANIMVGAFGEVQVMDWGLAKVLAEGGVADEERASRAHRPAEVEPSVIRTARSGAGSETETGSLLGTPAYMPPEQANGDVANLDRRADVFGLGAILCEVLTGKPPYVGRSGEEVRRKAANGDLADARARLDACGADAELVALTTACLSPEAIDRPRDAQAVTNALTTYLDGVQDRLRRAEVDKAAAEARAAEELNTRRMAEARAAEEWRRRRAQAGLATAVVALVGLTGVGVWYQQRQRTAAQAERASRRAATAASVAESLVDARRRMGEAWAASSFLDRMQAATDAATAAVKRAEGYAASGELAEASRTELDDIRAPLADLVRHTRLVADYEWLQDRFYNWEGDAGNTFVDTAVRRHEEAVKRLGLEPLHAPEDRTARAIAADPLRDTLIGLLSTWREHRKDWYRGDTEAGKKRSSWELRPGDRVEYERLGRVIRLTRRQCGGAYARWQELLDRKDMKGLAAFAASPEVLGLGPQLIGALARDLSETALDHEAARNLLRAAVERHPDAVSIRQELVVACMALSPPRYLERLQQYAALTALKPDSLMFQHGLGHSYSYLGDNAQAIVIHRKAADRGSVVSAMDVGSLSLEAGDFDGAVASYRQAVALAPATPLGAKSYTAEAESSLGVALRYRAIQERLPRLLGGEDRPGSAAEAVEIARACQYKRYYEAMPSFYAIAFALEPKLADDVEAWHRYNAACGAALAADGRGDDAARLDEAARAKRRRQALSWLRDDLTEWTRRVAGGQVSDRSKARGYLAHWLRDGDFAGVRGAAALAKLPAEERQAWAKLWADVEALLRKAQEAPK